AGSNRNPDRDGVIVTAPAGGRPVNVARPLTSVTPWRFAAPANCNVTSGSGRRSRRMTVMGNPESEATAQGRPAVTTMRTPANATPRWRDTTFNGRQNAEDQSGKTPPEHAGIRQLGPPAIKPLEQLTRRQAKVRLLSYSR